MGYEDGNRDDTMIFNENNMYKKPRKKKHYWWKLVLSAIAFGLIAALVFQGVNVCAEWIRSNNRAEVEQVQDEGTTIGEGEVETTVPQSAYILNKKTDVKSVVEECMPSIVCVTNLSIQDVRSFFGDVQQQESTSLGSGIIVGQSDTELLIVTNNHVVEGAETLTITFIDDSNVEAKVKGTDADRDVAVVAVKVADLKEDTLSAIRVATLGDSNNLTVGEDAIAIGNALGYGQSVTRGIVSALHRTMEGISGELIQTDAAINPGNSGGALLDNEGKVIGINVAKLASTEVEGVGYAIPISDVEEIIHEFMNREIRDQVAKEERGSLGIYCSDVSSSMAQAYNMPEGIYVSQLLEGGGAAKAGIQQGDVIIKLDGQSVLTSNALVEALSYYRIGETVPVTIKRLSREGEYEEFTFDVTLSKSSAQEPSENQDAQEQQNNGGNGFGYDDGENEQGNEEGNGIGGFDDLWRYWFGQ